MPNAANNLNSLDINQASVVLDHKACLNDVTVSFSGKGISVIVGSNGAGKTLLLKLCAGLLTPSSGQCEWAQPMTPPQLTWVPQKPVLLQRSVFDNILLPLEKYIENPQQRVNAALQWANIESLSHLPAATLSTGQQQLVALARAWALQPQWLLLDEPCANLDPMRQQQINQLIMTLRDEGCRIIMSSHHLTQVKELADDILFMQQGTVLATLLKDDFFNQNFSAIDDDIAQHIKQFIQYA